MGANTFHWIVVIELAVIVGLLVRPAYR